MYPPLRSGQQWFGGLPCTECGQLVAERARIIWVALRDTDGKPMPAVVLCSDECEAVNRAAAPSNTLWMSMQLATYLAQAAMSARLTTETLEELERLAMAGVMMSMLGEDR